MPKVVASFARPGNERGSHFAPQHLTDERPRQVGDRDDAFRYLVCSQPQASAAQQHPRGVSVYEFDVTFLAEDGDPEPELLERFTAALTYRLELLDERDSAYPKVGDSSYFLDNFERPFAWEMSDAEIEANPATGVY